MFSIVNAPFLLQFHLDFEHLDFFNTLRFLELFPWALGFSLRNSFNLPRIFRTSVFRIPQFSKSFLGSLRMYTLDISNFYIQDFEK